MLDEGDEEFMDPEQMAQNELPDKAPLQSVVKEVDMEQWANLSASQMADHISLGAPKTDFEAERNTRLSQADKLTNFWMDRLDSEDPSLGQDMTSEFMDVSKMKARIINLEKKVEEESHGFD